MFKEFEPEFPGQSPEDGMILPDPLAAEIDPAFSFAAVFPREHPATRPVAGLQDQDRRVFMQCQDAPRRHESGQSGTDNNDISHVSPRRSRSFSWTF
jgi:hypothetical protein